MMRQRIEDAYRYGGGRHSGLEPVMKQIISELERLEALITTPSESQERRPTKAEAAQAASVLLRCNRWDLAVWSDSEWPTDTDFLKNIVRGSDDNVA